MKTSAAPYPEIRNPIVVCLMSKRPKQVALFCTYSVVMLILLQHSHCTIVTIIFGPFPQI